MPKIKNWDKRQERGVSKYGKEIPATWVNKVNAITEVQLGKKRVEIAEFTESGRRVKTKKKFETQEKARE